MSCKGMFASLETIYIFKDPDNNREIEINLGFHICNHAPVWLETQP